MPGKNKTGDGKIAKKSAKHAGNAPAAPPSPPAHARASALLDTRVSRFLKKEGGVIVAPTVREILDELIAMKRV